MRIEQLKYFQKTAETGSITAASQQLFISQQALSGALKKLEEEFGTELFNRTTHGVTLTENGRYLLAAATEVLAKLDDIHLHFLKQNAEDLTLNIGSIAMAYRHILPKSISYFYRNLPNVRLNITTLSTKQILEQLAAESLDLGFVSTLNIGGEDNFVYPDNLNYTPLLNLPFQIAMAKDHPLNKHSSLSFEQLAPYSALLLDFGELEGYLPYTVLKHYGIKSIIPVNNEVLFNQMLKDGIGYALYTQVSSQNQPLDPSLTLHALKENIFSTIGYLHSKTQSVKSTYIKLFCQNL